MENQSNVKTSNLIIKDYWNYLNPMLELNKTKIISKLNLWTCQFVANDTPTCRKTWLNILQEYVFNF